MNYEEAIESTVSGPEAVREISRHGWIAEYDGNELFLAETGEMIATANPDGEFSGSEILEWLGY